MNESLYDRDEEPTPPRRRWTRILIFAAGVLAAALVATALFTSEDPTRSAQAGRGVKTLAGLELTSFETSQPLALDSFRGTPLVLNTWASWCTFCIAEMPDFEAVHQSLGKRVRFLGVNVQDIASEAKRFAASTGVTYEIAVDRDASFFKKIGGIGMPTTLFVDSEGRVLEKVTGPLSREALESKINKHFGI